MHKVRPVTEYKRLKMVSSQRQLLEENFSAEINLILWRRTLRGDFNALAAVLVSLRNENPREFGGYNYLEFGSADKKSNNVHLSQLRLAVSRKPDLAIPAAQILRDIEEMALPNFAETQINLRLIEPGGYDDGRVYKFHPDGVKRLMFAYNDPATECIDNEDYQEDRPCNMRSGAAIFFMQAGDAWLQNEKGCPNPFFHRAPDTKRRSMARLLLVCSYPLPEL